MNKLILIVSVRRLYFPLFIRWADANEAYEVDENMSDFKVIFFLQFYICYSNNYLD